MTSPILSIDKTVLLGTQPEYYRGNYEHPAWVFCFITFKDGGLSITGVIGPLNNGNAIGSCGQILDSIRVTNYAEGWDKHKVKRFIEIWGRWHLNDCRPYTTEMREQGWGELAKKKITKYSFLLTKENSKLSLELKDLIIKAAIDGKTYPLTEEHKRLLKSKVGAEVYGYTQPEPPEFKELQTFTENGKVYPKTSVTTLGWVTPEKHPDGLLGKKLNGKGYGSAWYYEEVPQDVLQWLADLPNHPIPNGPWSKK